MVSKGHLIVKWLEVKELLNRISNCNLIELGNHVLMVLSKKQRMICSQQELIQIVKYEEPLRVGLQENGLYAIFYDYKENKVIKLVIDISGTKVFIVTFHIMRKQKIPTLK